MKGSLCTNFISERNFADVSTRCFRPEAWVKFLAEIKLVYREPFIVYAKAQKPPLH